jgi:hypothetical protein
MQSNQFVELEALVQEAEVHRQGQRTAEVQRYLDTHPALPQYTRNLTHEMQAKILFHLANGDKTHEAQIREEVNVIRAQIDALNEPGNVLFSLLGEEIVLSYLMLRQCDVSAARQYGQTSTQALRRADASHVRLMRAIRTLASIQKLSPFINVNLGTQQIAMTR